MGSIKSAFQFRSYKIDHIKYAMQKNVGLLGYNGVITPEMLKMQIKIRQPIFDKKNKIYIGGLDTHIELTTAAKKNKEDNAKVENLFNLEIGIAGIFYTEEGRFDEKIEKQLVKIQIPAILFPYVRATISSFFSNAGFGAIVLPLINIQEIAKNTMKDIEILKIE